MSYLFRAARLDDLPEVYNMAKGAGGGLTNLPPDRSKLEAKLESSAIAFDHAGEVLRDDVFFFVLEDVETGKARGTCQIFSRIGATWPFYSYRINSFAKYSKVLGRTIAAETLTLSTDLGGSTEVGGLFLHPAFRTPGAGALLARSRYLFIREHRARFADRTVADLRGALDEAGRSPFWDGVAGRFFQMDFHEADEFNGVHGNQFIADFMPQHPIYTALLPDSVLQAIGVPHDSGRAAQRMLQNEGFVFNNYIDIFDGGPTMTAATDDIATIRETREDVLVRIEDYIADATESIVARGRLVDFRACYGKAAAAKGGISLDASSAKALCASVGDSISYVKR